MNKRDLWVPRTLSFGKANLTKSPSPPAHIPAPSPLTHVIHNPHAAQNHPIATPVLTHPHGEPTYDDPTLPIEVSAVEIPDTIQHLPDAAQALNRNSLLHPSDPREIRFDVTRKE